MFRLGRVFGSMKWLNFYCANSYSNCNKIGQMIVARNMNFSLSEGRAGESILENINLTIDKGSYLSVCGAEGSGKSSLLMLLGLYERPSSGELYFLGQDVSQMSNRRLETIRRGNIGYVGHRYTLLKGYDVVENMSLPLVYLNYGKSDRRRMVGRIMELLGIGHLSNLKVEDLNMLQVQLVTLGRAVVANPHLLIADEPTAMVNSRYVNDFMAALGLVNDQGITVVHGTSSSYLADKAIRKIELYDGHLIS